MALISMPLIVTGERVMPLFAAIGAVNSLGSPNNLSGIVIILYHLA
jgi:hypothetical protein